MVTPAKIVTFAPIQQSSPIMTSLVNSVPRCLRRASIFVSCSPVMMFTFGPISTLFPMVTSPQSRTVKLLYQPHPGAVVRSTAYLKFA